MLEKNNKSYRIETDTMGEIKVESDKYWGAQTERSLNNFKISKDYLPNTLIKSLAIVKMCSAKANKKLKLIDEKKADIIIEVAQEIIEGKLDNHFPLIIWQTGSGTQSNMNINEVISNRAIEKLHGKLGGKEPIHPNDDVNKGQSSNDTFPSAMNIATILDTTTLLLPALEKLEKTLERKVNDFKEIIKIGRTHLQDATPLTLGQEFSGYLHQIIQSKENIKQAMINVFYLAQGATAVGTGINTSKDFTNTFIDYIKEYTGLPFLSAKNKFSAIATHDDLVNFSSALNTLAVSLTKIANDIRFLSCGPRAGIFELILPSNEPGSSIMPGKVNPTQIEALTMVCFQVMGNNYAVSLGGMSGQLELNAYKPLIIFNILKSISLLSNSINSFVDNCLSDLAANTLKIKENLENSLMLVTALNKHIGYDKAAKIAKYAFNSNTSLKKASLKLGLVSEEDFDRIVDPKTMV